MSAPEAAASAPTEASIETSTRASIEAGSVAPDPDQAITRQVTPDAERDLGVSELAGAFVSAGGIRAVLFVLMFLATPILLLFLVVLTASVIHRFG